MTHPAHHAATFEARALAPGLSCAILFTVLTLLGCGRNAPSADRLDTAAPVAAAPDSAQLAGGGCPETGRWRECSVEKRLERAGLVIAREGEVRHPFLSVPGTRYRVGREELQVFLYPGIAEREQDLAQLDSARAAPAGDPHQWAAQPTLMWSGNLAAILLGGSPRHVERVSNALTAGLPQP